MTRVNRVVRCRGAERSYRAAGDAVCIVVVTVEARERAIVSPKVVVVPRVVTLKVRPRRGVLVGHGGQVSAM